MPTTITRPRVLDQHLVYKRLRRKDDAADDPDWYTSQWDPGMFQGTVASVAAGSLTVQITPVDTERWPTPDPIAVTITTETAAQAAEAVYNEAVSHLTSSAVDFDGDLALYIERMEYTSASAVVRFVPRPGAPRFVVTMTPTGGGMTFTLSPDDTFPITTHSAQGVGEKPAPTHVVLSVHSVTSSDEVLGIGTCTFDLQGLRVVDRVNAPQLQGLRPGVADEGTLTGLTLGEPVVLAVGGGRWGVRITNLANAPAGHDALAVHYHEVTR